MNETSIDVSALDRRVSNREMFKDVPEYDLWLSNYYVPSTVEPAMVCHPLILWVVERIVLLGLSATAVATAVLIVLTVT